MKKWVIIFLIAVSISSCFKIFEAINSKLIIEKDCWIDTETLTFYYYGGEIVEGVNIYLLNDDKKIEFKNDRIDTRSLIIQLDSLRPVLTRQSVVISVDRFNTHWRDYQRIKIEKEDWTTKKRVNSTHTHH